MAEPEGGLSPTEYAVGIFLVCLGCACASTGLLLMKESTVHEGERPFFLRWRWLIGFCFLGILTTVVDVYVLGILPLSLVAPFAGLTIVFTLLIASSGARARRPSVPPPGRSPLRPTPTRERALPPKD